MKNPAWKKDFVVVMHSDYDNTWIDKTVACTMKQAVKFVYAKRWGHALDKGTVRIVTLAEFEQMQKQTTWQHNAPFNSQFLGAQPAHAGEDY